MTIPLICIIRSLIDVPCMYMIFGHHGANGNFWIAISGLFGEYFLAKGWTSSAMLILQTVVDPQISYLGINMFITLGNIDNVISAAIKNFVTKLFDIDPK